MTTTAGTTSLQYSTVRAGGGNLKTIAGGSYGTLVANRPPCRRERLFIYSISRCYGYGVILPDVLLEDYPSEAWDGGSARVTREHILLVMLRNVRGA